jgi:serine/threonine protein kinase
MKTSGPGQQEGLTSAPERPVRPPVPPVIPDHELLRKIGGGAYGEVWLARNILGAWRAVKIVYRNSFDHDRPFEREFAGIQKFEPISRTHQSQVDILHVGRGEGYFYYVMELADDATALPASEAAPASQPATFNFQPATYQPHSLKLDLQRRGRLPVDECIQLGLSLSTALAHLHSHGLIHRDVKPSNIIFINGIPKLADIGLVTDVEATRSFVGTEGFIPPEGPSSVQADLYSLGKVLYEMSMGRSRLDFPALPANWDELPQAEQARLLEFNEVLVKACENDPRKRYQSAQQMATELTLLQDQRSVRRKHLMERRWTMLKKTGLIAAVLALLLAVSSLIRIVRHERTPDPEAVRLYELGRWYQQQLTDESLKKAIISLEQAIERDPKYVEPYMALVALYTWNVPGLSEEETLRRIKQLAAKLLKLNPNLAEGHIASSYADYLQGNWAGVEAEIQLALRLNLNNSQAHIFCCYYYSLLGRVEEAAEHGRRAQELDPTSRIAATIAGFPYITARHFDLAIAQFRKALELEDFPLTHEWVAKALEAKGDYLAALVEFEKNAILSGEDEAKARKRFGQVRQAFNDRGRDGYWLKVLEIQLEAEASHEEAKIGTQNRWPLDGVYAQLGQNEKALDLLSNDFKDGGRNDWLKLEPLYYPLRDEPRFKAFLKLAGLEK